MGLVLELDRYLHELGFLLDTVDRQLIVSHGLLLLADVGALQFNLFLLSVDCVL